MAQIKSWLMPIVASICLLSGCKKDQSKEQEGLAKVSTNEISSVRASSAQGSGQVLSQGNSPVTARGMCWSTTSNPTIDNASTSSGSGAGVFAASLSNLSPGTTYFARSYAVNNQGISYGNQVSFTTQNQPDTDFWQINGRLFESNALGAIWAPGTRSLGAISITQGGVFTTTFKEKPMLSGQYKVRDATNVKQADLKEDECIIIILSPGVPNIFSSADNAASPVEVLVNNGKITVRFVDIDFNYIDGTEIKTVKGSAVVPER
jgi:hypothetical protein